MNWGHKILIVIILFLISMTGMVIYAVMQTNEMIDDQYYQKELIYQEVIDAKKNLLDITSINLISQTLQEVVITLPPGTFEDLEKGHIELLRNDAASNDVHMDMVINGSNRSIFPKEKLIKGLYKARIQWSNGGKPFYKEESVFVEK